MPKYDYLVVGAGLFGSIFAREATDRGKRVLVIDRRNHIAGNIYTRDVDGINVHEYGPHIFHTSQEYIWNYITRFAEFNNFTLRTKAMFGGHVYSLPINLFTMHQIWPDVVTPADAIAKLATEVRPNPNPANLEEHMLAQVGPTLYEMFVKGYTEKQWGRLATQLPASIIKRLPIRLTMNDRYFHDSHRWEGIPIGGYTRMVENMLHGIEVKLGIDYLNDRAALNALASKVVYSGAIDTFFDYSEGRLEYRSLRFETEKLPGDYQGNAIINFTESHVPYTRIVEHKHFEFQNTSHTVITREYPAAFTGTNEPYYPVNDVTNNSIYDRYRERTAGISNVIFGGRLASYRYYDMDMTVGNSLSVVKRELSHSD
jgi:UDP-galactopyranose mutase